MNIKRILAIFVRQVFLYQTNPIRLTAIFLWPFLEILQWGFITKYLSKLGETNFSFTTVVLGTVILFEFMTRVDTSIMTTFLEDIWSNNLLNLFSTPIRISEYLSGMVLTSIVIGSVNLIFVSILAGLVFRYNIVKIGVIVWFSLTILLIFGISLGIFTTAIIFKHGPAAEWLGWPLPFVLSVFSGVFYPIKTLPPSLQNVSKILPSSYVFESLRECIINNSLYTKLIIQNLMLSLLLSIIFLFISFIFFLKIYKTNLISGSIARFSAYE